MDLITRKTLPSWVLGILVLPYSSIAQAWAQGPSYSHFGLAQALELASWQHAAIVTIILIVLYRVVVYNSDAIVISLVGILLCSTSPSYSVRNILQC